MSNMFLPYIPFPSGEPITRYFQMLYLKFWIILASWLKTCPRAEIQYRHYVLTGCLWAIQREKTRCCAGGPGGFYLFTSLTLKQQWNQIPSQPYCDGSGILECLDDPGSYVSGSTAPGRVSLGKHVPGKVLGTWNAILWWGRSSF